MSREIESRAPADGKLLGTVAGTSPDRLGEIVDRGRRAQAGWQQAGSVARGLAISRLGRLIEERADDLAPLAAVEVGKPIAEARAEVSRAAHICAYYAGVAHERGGILRNSLDPQVTIMARQVPLGVAAVVTPWNFPIAIPLWKMIPGLASGCTIVWKPASPAVLTAERVAALFAEAGFPEDVVQVVYGDGKVGEALTRAEVDAVTFTGSTAVGRALREKLGPRARPRISLELGGVNVSHVLADADIERAASAITAAAFGYAGQKCTATQVVAVDAGAADDLRDALRAAVARVVVGDPLGEGVVAGPLIDASAAAHVRDQVEALGATEIAAAAAPDGPAFVAPSLLDLASDGGALAREEIFGPVLGVTAISSEEDRQALASASGMGLSAAIYTRDFDRARKVANLVGAGVVAVNRPSTGLDPHVPFGGWKESGGDFAEQGLVGLDFFTKWQTIYWRGEEPGAGFP